MYYSISRTLEIMPYISYAILTIFLILLEIRNWREHLTDSPCAEPGRDGFIPPPGNGYEHYISSNAIVYLLRKSAKKYRVYLVRGETTKARIKCDRYGRYFKVTSDNPAAAERIAEKVFTQ